MEYKIRTESDRIPQTIAFIENQIEELNLQLKECDYIEDINGDKIYSPNEYSLEKREISASIRKWKIALRLLTAALPTTVFDW